MSLFILCRLTSPQNSIESIGKFPKVACTRLRRHRVTCRWSRRWVINKRSLRGSSSLRLCGAQAGGRLSRNFHRIERLMRLWALKARTRRRRLPPDPGSGRRAPLLPRYSMASLQPQLPTATASRSSLIFNGGRMAVCGRRSSTCSPARGWSMSATMTAQLVTNALVMAI
jgi:hypothetical protein